MTGKTFAWVAMIAISVPATVQAAKPPLELKHSSAWNVDYADDRCRLIRQFGQGDERVFAAFDRYGPGEQFRMTLAGKPVRTALDKGNVSIRFGPGEGEQKLSFYTGTLGKFPALVITSSARLAPITEVERLAIENRAKDEWIDVAPISEARQKAVRYLKIGKPLRRTVTLETGSMAAPLSALDKCIENLLTHWGIDVQRHKLLTRSATPKQSPDRWVVSSDYPLKMLDAGQPAIVEFRLSVGADGVPTSCHIQSTTRPKEFDNAVCKSVMRRARFDPALDAEGKPLASYYRNTVHFQLP